MNQTAMFLRVLREDMKKKIMPSCLCSAVQAFYLITFNSESKVTKTAELQEKLSEQLDQSSDNFARSRPF